MDNQAVVKLTLSLVKSLWSWGSRQSKGYLSTLKVSTCLPGLFQISSKTTLVLSLSVRHWSRVDLWYEIEIYLNFMICHSFFIWIETIKCCYKDVALPVTFTVLEHWGGFTPIIIITLPLGMLWSKVFGKKWTFILTS